MVFIVVDKVFSLRVNIALAHLAQPPPRLVPLVGQAVTAALAYLAQQPPRLVPLVGQAVTVALDPQRLKIVNVSVKAHPHYNSFYTK